MSRSERMPTTRRSAPRIINAPMRFSASSATAAARVALGSMVTTSRPLPARMMLTVIIASLCFTAQRSPGRVGTVKVLAIMFYTSSGFQRHHECAYCSALFAAHWRVVQRGKIKYTPLTARPSVGRPLGWLGVARLSGRFRLRNFRIKSVEQDQAGKKAADMGLPGDRLAVLAADRHRAEAEQHVQSEPDDQEHQEPDVGERRQERPRRHAMGAGFAGETEQTAALKDKTHRRRHGG